MDRMTHSESPSAVQSVLQPLCVQNLTFPGAKWHGVVVQQRERGERDIHAMMMKTAVSASSWWQLCGDKEARLLLASVTLQSLHGAVFVQNK